jgi:hypothetical protein
VKRCGTYGKKKEAKKRRVVAVPREKRLRVRRYKASPREDRRRGKVERHRAIPRLKSLPLTSDDEGLKRCER